jgi:hypothetical protein
MIVRDFADLEEYLPSGHDGVINRLLAGRSRGDGVIIWHTRFEPGGMENGSEADAEVLVISLPALR